MTAFSKALLTWYHKNKRDLPWRHTRSPYPIWLSEVILQQTRVNQGMAYYHRFLELFPTIGDLAAAPSDKVMKAWQGLGYYSRARNLHTTAKEISDHRGGIFPPDAAGLAKLKGIGPYTAAAIASFAYNEPVAVVDGNVMRVLTRIFGISEPIDSRPGRLLVEEKAAELMDKEKAGEFNQAIMEFGATHCTPVNPDCVSCPFRRTCVAFKMDAVREFPVKAKKTAVKDVWLYYFHITWKGKTYLRKRTGKGIWQGLYDFPGVESSKKTSHSKIVGEFMNTSGLSGISTWTATSDTYTHILSHRKISAVFFRLECRKKWEDPPAETFAASTGEMGEYGIPRLIDKYLHDHG